MNIELNKDIAVRDDGATGLDIVRNTISTIAQAAINPQIDPSEALELFKTDPDQLHRSLEFIADNPVLAVVMARSQERNVKLASAKAVLESAAINNDLSDNLLRGYFQSNNQEGVRVIAEVLEDQIQLFAGTDQEGVRNPLTRLFIDSMTGASMDGFDADSFTASRTCFISFRNYCLKTGNIAIDDDIEKAMVDVNQTFGDTYKIMNASQDVKRLNNELTETVFTDSVLGIVKSNQVLADRCLGCASFLNMLARLYEKRGDVPTANEMRVKATQYFYNAKNAAPNLRELQNIDMPRNGGWGIIRAGHYREPGAPDFSVAEHSHHTFE